MVKIFKNFLHENRQEIIGKMFGQMITEEHLKQTAEDLREVEDVFTRIYKPHNMKKYKVQLIITALERYKSVYGGSKAIDMNNWALDKDSSVCHACCFGIGYGLEKAKHWHDAAEIIANRLEFNSVEDLIKYMHEHPSIWGNSYGRLMFHDKIAFGLYGSEVLIIDIIIEHWKGVKERLPL